MEILTADDIATLLGTHRASIVRWFRLGYLPGKLMCWKKQLRWVMEAPVFDAWLDYNSQPDVRPVPHSLRKYFKERNHVAI